MNLLMFPPIDVLTLFWFVCMGCSAIHIIYNDIYHHEFSLLSLIILTMSSLLNYTQWSGGFESCIMMMIMCCVIQLIVRWGRVSHKTIFMGYGDVFIIIIMGLWIEPSKIPYFMVVTGCLGLCLHCFFKQKIIPFTPVVFLSTIILHFF
jgi:hypothetical protein